MYKIKLSPYHKTFYNEWKLDSSSSRYNITFVQMLYGEINVDRLKNALKRMVRERVILNSHVKYYDNELFWISNDEISELEYTEGQVNDDEILQYVSQGFDLLRGPLYRFKLVSISPSKYLFIIVFHHLLIDGSSAEEGVFESISKYYNCYDYSENYTIEQQISALESLTNSLCANLQKYNTQYKEFWKSLLSGVESIDLRFIKLNHTIHRNSSRTLPSVKEIRFNFYGPELQKINQISHKYLVTPYIFSMCVFAILLHRYTSQTTIAISYPVSIKEGRSYIYGAQVNTNIIPYYFTKSTTIIELFKQSRNLFKSLKHNGGNYSYNPISNIIEVSNKRLLDINFIQTYLKDKIFNFEGIHKVEILDKFNIDSVVKMSANDATVPIFFEQELSQRVFKFRVRYESTVFDSVLVEDFITSYKNLFLTVLDELLNTETPKVVDKYNMLSLENYEQIVHYWNSTERVYPKHKNIHSLFEDQVQKTPLNVAMIYESKQYTYCEVNALSNQLAHYLLRYIDSTKFIILCIDRNEYMLPSIIGILKLGVAYVPIDPEYPDERISYIISDTNANIIITSSRYKNRLKNLTNVNNFIIPLEEIQTELINYPSSNLNLDIASNSIAYIMYTSGSTGIPRGVMIEHHSVVNRLLWMNEAFKIAGDDNILQKTPYVFDVSVWELFWGVWNGSCVVFAQPNGHKDVEYLLDIIINKRITIIHFVPSMFTAFLDYLELKQSTVDCLRYIICSGEALNMNQVQKCRRLLPNIQIYNLYGPTEACIDVTYYNCTASNYINIGRPISNTKIYITDDNLNILPIGVIGELCISGAGLARGYLNLPNETNEKFIKNPFATDNNSILYKTGDLARFNPDGNIEYIGRRDDQVKLRGYRIELGEIESVVNSHPEVSNSVAIVRNIVGTDKDFNEHKYIVVYYTTIIKDKKSDLSKYILGWKSVYEEIYRTDASGIIKNSFIGWNSSYTRRPIEISHMREWLANSISRILNLDFKYILEIGSGSGLILENISPKCDYYYASDFSFSASSHLKYLVNKNHVANKVQVLTCSAHDVPFHKISHPIDTVIFNSVIQYFPNVEYLELVINNLIFNFENLSQIFIGDIRDFRLLDTFYYSVLSFKQDIVTQREIEFYKRRDKELIISPKYFIYLIRNIPKIDYIEFLVKETDLYNELSQFRYDLIIYIKKEGFQALTEFFEVDYNMFSRVDDLYNYLHNTALKDILFIKYPYKNSYVEYVKYYNFKSNNSANYAEKKLLSISEIKALAEQIGLNCKFYLDIEDAGYLNIIFYDPKIIQKKFKIIYHVNVLDEHDQLNNNPSITMDLLDLNLTSEIKYYVNQKLPSYMVPDVFVHLENLPITINGKLDKAALPDPENVVVDSYYAPRNEIESIICDVFARVLSIPSEMIGIKHDFFRMGGNSILAIKLVTELQHNFKITVADIFSLRTPEAIAKHTVYRKSNLIKQLEYIKSMNTLKISYPKNKEVELKKEKYIQEAANISFKNIKMSIKTVLLTGATGHVGCNILYQLLKETDCKIYILARPSNGKDCYTRLNNKFKYYFNMDLDVYESRLEVFNADIVQTDLGLSLAQYQKLVNDTDSIIHVAGYVKYYGDYKDFYKVNVQTTRNLLELAILTKSKNFHYISTIGVFKDGYIPNQPYYYFIEEDSPDLLMHRRNLYVQSKCEGEKLVKEYNKRGVLSNIYRLGNVAMHSSTYVHQDNLYENAFFIKFKTILTLEAADEKLATVEISPVDSTALAIVRLFNQTDLINQTFHIFNPNFCKLDEIFKLDNRKITICPTNSFIDKIVMNLKAKKNVELLELFLLHQNWLQETNKYTTEVKILEDKSLAILSKLGFKWPSITLEMLKNGFGI